MAQQAIHRTESKGFNDGRATQAGNPGRRRQVRRLLRLQRHREAGFQRRQGPRLDRTGMGICHSYAPDGRCISLLKILLTNFCIYDCLYCVNRTSSQRAARALHRRRGGEAHASTSTGAITSRACSSPPASSASPDYTMEQMVERRAQAARGASVPRLHPSQDHPGGRRRADRGGRPICRPALDQYRAADGRRASQRSRRRKTPRAIRRTMGRLRLKLDEAQEATRAPQGKAAALRAGRPDHADDRRRRRGDRRRPSSHTSASLYGAYRLQARLLFGLQPDPGCQPRAAAGSRRR